MVISSWDNLRFGFLRSSSFNSAGLMVSISFWVVTMENQIFVLIWFQCHQKLVCVLNLCEIFVLICSLYFQTQYYLCIGNITSSTKYAMVPKGILSLCKIKIPWSSCIEVAPDLISSSLSFKYQYLLAYARP